MQYFVERLTDGETMQLLFDNWGIERMPLLRAGQVLSDLAHGWHPVTGGSVYIGTIVRATRILGIAVLGMPPNFDGTYVPGNQPFNLNFSRVLYELKKSGVTHVNRTTLDYATGGRYSQLNTDFVESCRASAGHPTGSGVVSLTYNLIGAIAS